MLSLCGCFREHCFLIFFFLLPLAKTGGDERENEREREKQRERERAREREREREEARTRGVK